MLNCQEVTRTIASEEFAEAGWWRRLWIQLHLFGCRHCRRYAAQLRALGGLARNLWNPVLEDPNTLKQLERTILQKVSETPQSRADDISKNPFRPFKRRLKP